MKLMRSSFNCIMENRYVDGGWSKRSHKHSYNVKSGVAIIIGKETGKLLHIGVRNKFCHACARKIPVLPVF